MEDQMDDRSEATRGNKPFQQRVDYTKCSNRTQISRLIDTIQTLVIIRFVKSRIKSAAMYFFSGGCRRWSSSLLNAIVAAAIRQARVAWLLLQRIARLNVDPAAFLRKVTGMLQGLFGPSKDEVWRQLAHEIGAQVVGDGFWSGTVVKAQVKEWTITLDTYAVSTGKTMMYYTRMRAPYINKDGLRFTIHRRGVFSDLGKWLGGQDIEVGDPVFDDLFIIKGNDAGKVQQLFANAQLRSLIQAQPQIHLEVRDDEGWFGASFPEGVDELRFHVVGIIKDIERLKLLYELFAETLQQLCVIGSAYEDNPRVTL
jgi:hypothetical protein